MALRSAALAGAIVATSVALAWAGAQQEVAACSPACSDLHGIESAHREVARDGVLVFRMDTGGYPDRQRVFEALSIEVRTSDGSELAGELRFEHALLVWDPGCALPEGEKLTATFELDRDHADLEDCGDAENSFTSERFEVVPRDLSPIGASSACFTSLYTFTPDDDVGALVCCDGAYPSQEEWVGSCDEDDHGPVMVGEGACSTRTGTGSVKTRFELPMPTEASDAANLVARLVFADGSTIERLMYDEDRSSGSIPTIFREHDDAADVRLELVSLATGQVIAGETIRSDGGAPTALGHQSLDIQDSLDATCTGMPYVCSDFWDGDIRAWNPDDCQAFEPERGIDPEGLGNTDPNACTPYAMEVVAPPEEGDDADACLVLNDRGCSCSARAPGDRASIVVLLLLLPLTRRPGRASRRGRGPSTASESRSEPPASKTPRLL